MTKTKLRTFLEIFEPSDPRALVKANLKRSQWSLIAKLRLGVLPLSIETGRWKDVQLEKRLCPICEERCLENEYHFILFCEHYKKMRTEYLQEIVDKTDLVIKGSESDMLRTLLSNKALNISGRYIEKMFMEHKAALFNNVVVDKDEDDVSERGDVREEE